MNDDNKCDRCGKYSGGATLCNACQKAALKKPKPKKGKAGFKFQPGDKIENVEEMHETFTVRIIATIVEEDRHYYRISSIHPWKGEGFKVLSREIVEHFYKGAA